MKLEFMGVSEIDYSEHVGLRHKSAAVMRQMPLSDSDFWKKGV